MYVSSLSGASFAQVPDLSQISSDPRAGSPGSPPQLPLLAVAAGSRPSGAAFVSSLLESGWRARGSLAPELDDDPGRLMLLDATEREVDAPSQPGPEEVLSRADVYVGLASAAWERKTLPLVAELGLPAVVASNGLEGRDLGWLAEVSRRIPWVLEPSFAMGFAWLRAKVHARGSTREVPSSSRRVPPPSASERVEMPAPAQIDVLGPAPFLSGARLFPKLGSMLSDREANTDGLAYAIEWLWARQNTLAPGRYHLARMLADETSE